MTNYPDDLTKRQIKKVLEVMMRNCFLVLVFAAFIGSHVVNAQDIKTWKPQPALEKLFDANATKLQFKSGVILPKNIFGPHHPEISAIVACNEGQDLYLIGDEKKCFLFSVRFNNEMNFASPLAQAFKKEKSGDIDEDVEGIARISDSSFVVSFDRKTTLDDQQMIKEYQFAKNGNEIFEISNQSLISSPQIQEKLRNPDFSNNDGYEGIAAIPGIGVVVLKEKANDGHNLGWLLTRPIGSGRLSMATFKYQPGSISADEKKVNLEISDATNLNGDLIVLERYYFEKENENEFRKLIALRIMRYSHTELLKIKRKNFILNQGTVLLRYTPETLKELKKVDKYKSINFEGITAFSHLGKEYLYLISDDNEGNTGDEGGTHLALFEIPNSATPTPIPKPPTIGTCKPSSTDFLTVPEHLLEIANEKKFNLTTRILAMKKLSNANLDVKPKKIDGKTVNEKIVELLEKADSVHFQYACLDTIMSRVTHSNNLGDPENETLSSLMKISRKPSTDSELRKTIIEKVVQRIENR